MQPQRELQQFVFLLISLVMSLLSYSALHATSLPLPPRISVNAYSGVYTVGQADLMLSVDGNRQHNFYVDPQGSYGSDQQWLGDLGLGYRWIQNDVAILGGYVFAGRTRVANNSRFWITNPGVEILGSRWDTHLNVYLPVAGRSHEVGREELNIVSEPFFTGHTEVINSVFSTVNEVQQIGNGIDAKLGYQIFRQVPLKAYLGAYFFAIPHTDNLRGGAAGLEYWVNQNIKVFANYNYDNYQHSKIVGGLGISFGGVRKQWADPTLSERLTDPVERYLANIGHGSAIPSQTLLYGMEPGSSSQLITTDIAFFSQSGMPNNGGVGLTLANCTFENPCGPADLTNVGASTLNTLLPNTLLYFNGGSYAATDVLAGINPVTLQAGQTVSSRTADYSQTATGADRSIFNGGFILNSNNTLENSILLPTAATAGNAILVNNASNVLITGSQIGSPSNPFRIAVSLSGSQGIISNSQIFSNLLTNQHTVEADNTSMLRIQASQLTITATTTSIFGSISGVFAVDRSSIDIADSVVTMTGNYNNSFFGLFSYSSNIQANNTLVSVTNNGSGAANVLGANTNGSPKGIIQVNQGTLMAAGTNPAIESILPGGGTIQITDSSCFINGSSVSCP